MRKENVVLLGICMLVAAGIGYITTLQISPKLALERLTTNMSNRGPSYATGEDEAEKKPQPELPKKVKWTGAVKPVAEPEPVQVGEAAGEPVVAPPPPQPELADIPTGMKRAALLDRYPVPAIHSSTLRDGSLMELLVYQKQGAPTATYAQLEDGAVTRVYAGLPARHLP